MRLWTNGRTTLSMNLGGLSVYADGRPTEHRQITAPQGKRKGGGERHLVLSVNEARGIVLAGESEGLLFLLDLKGKFPPRQLQLQVVDAAIASAAEFLLAIPGSGKKDNGVEFTLAELNKDGSLKTTAKLELPAPKKVKWPPSLGAGTWPKEAALSSSGLYMTANDFGAAVADPAAGWVLGLRPDSEKFDLSLQVPVTGAAFMYAVPSPKGIVVAVPAGKGASAILHFAADGKCLGSYNAPGSMGAPVLLGEERLAVVAEDELIELELPSLRAAMNASLGLKSKGLVQVAAVDEQKLMAANETQVWMLSKQEAASAAEEGEEEGEAAETWVAKALPSAQDKNALLPADAEMVKGPPSLQVSQPAFGPRLWSAKTGSTTSLTLLLANNGGEAQGVSIELSGDAMKKSLLKPVKAVAGQEKIDFRSVSAEKFVAEAPALIIEGAVEGPTEDAPPVSRADIELQVELKAHTAGTGLLMIRIATSDKQKKTSTCAFGRVFEVTKK